jgi:hypothetical protein
MRSESIGSSNRPDMTPVGAAGSAVDFRIELAHDRAEPKRATSPEFPLPVSNVPVRGVSRLNPWHETIDIAARIKGQNADWLGAHGGKI